MAGQTNISHPVAPDAAAEQTPELQLESTSQPPPPAPSALLLYNIKSGTHNLEALERFSTLLRAAGWTLEQADFEHIPDTFEAFSRVIVSGGDGSVNAVAHLLRGLDIPLMVIPSGTGNLVAQNLELPRTAEALAEVFLAGHSEAFDLAELSVGAGESAQTVGFTMLAGAGFDAEVIRESEALKSGFGVFGYVLAAMKQITPQEAEFTLELDGVTVQTRGLSVMLANFGLANLGLPIVSGIDSQDGRLNVIVLKGRTPLTLLPHLMDSIRGKLGWGDPLFEERLELYTCHQVRLQAEPVLSVQYDGDVLEGGTPLSARVLPGAVQFVCPPPPRER